MQRLIDGWVTTPKWWKGFYITFGAGVAVLWVMTSDLAFAFVTAFIWGSMVAFALWASEKLKARMGINSARSRDDTSEQDWRRRR